MVPDQDLKDTLPAQASALIFYSFPEMTDKDRPDFRIVEIDRNQDRSVLPDYGEILWIVSYVMRELTVNNPDFSFRKGVK